MNLWHARMLALSSRLRAETDAAETDAERVGADPSRDDYTRGFVRGFARGLRRAAQLLTDFGDV
jgi:hypothetical protein